MRYMKLCISGIAVGVFAALLVFVVGVATDILFAMSFGFGLIVSILTCGILVILKK